MTYAQVFNEAKQLTPAEKLDLVEALLRDLRQNTAPAEPSAGRPALTVEEKLRIVNQLHGILKPEHGEMPSDGDIRDAYTEDLIRKYLNK